MVARGLVIPVWTHCGRFGKGDRFILGLNLEASRTSGAGTELSNGEERTVKRMPTASGEEGYAQNPKPQKQQSPHISVEALFCMVPAPDER